MISIHNLSQNTWYTLLFTIFAFLRYLPTIAKADVIADFPYFEPKAEWGW